MRRERGCIEDKEDPYLFPKEWGEIRRCPRSMLLENPDLISLLNMGYSLEKNRTYEDYNTFPNSLMSALDVALEAMTYRQKKEAENG